jgi:N,N'-diacetyllegionaminate synthase
MQNLLKTSRVFIIAEAGVNHNGSLRLAKRMVDAAKDAKVDAVKFQAFKAEALVSEYAPKARYQKASNKESHLDMLKELELSENDLRKISSYCRKKKIMFIASIFDKESLKFINTLNVSVFKFGSGELTNLPLLKEAARLKRAMLLSTGMADMKEISEAVNEIYKTGNKKLFLLHCVSSYPAKVDNANLKAITSLKDKFRVPIGYSDHTEGMIAPVLAVALGAKIIEKHFTLSNKMNGPDHRFSLNPKELKEMVGLIRQAEIMLGSGIKKPMYAELEIRKISRKSIIASKNIPAGSKISADMLSIKRPGKGLSPKYLDRVIGRRATRLIKADTKIKWKDLSR